MCRIWPPKYIHIGMAVQKVGDMFKIAAWDQTVRIKNHHPIPFRTLKTIVAGKTLALVFLPEIMNVQPVGKGCHNLSGVPVTAVFDHQDFEIFYRLEGEALQEFPDFFRTVVQGDDYAKTHTRK